MSTAIPTPPNTIIAALLDIASVAYAVAHSGKVGPSAYAAVDADDLDKLETSLAVLELLPQIEVDGHLTGPARARKHLESFLEGGDVIDLIEKRTRAFPKMTITLAGTPEQQEALKDMLREHRSQPLMAVAAADTQVGCIEFEAQVWKAPAETPPDRERRLRERMIEPATPVVGKTALVEATRPLFVKAMQAEGYRADFDDFTGLYKDASEHRWEGWRAAVESMGFKPRVLEDWMRVLVFADMKERLALPSGDEGRIGADDVLDQLFEVSQAAMRKDPGARVRGGEYMHSEFGRVLVIGNHPHDGAARICETYIDDEAYYFLCDRCALKPLDESVTWDHLGWDDERPVGAYKTAKQAMHDHLLAATADEALRIINDAGLLKNLVELFTMRDPGTSVTIREQIPHLYEDFKWKLDIMPRGDRAARTYESTSLHQVIVVAHKGEQDHEYPEPEMCAYCGMSFETPCDAPPTGPCEQANNAFHGSDPTKPRPPAPANRRNEMIALLVRVKDELGVPAAKNIIRAYAPPPGIMADIPDQYIEAVIAACEEGLKQE